MEKKIKIYKCPPAILPLPSFLPYPPSIITLYYNPLSITPPYSTPSTPTPTPSITTLYSSTLPPLNSPTHYGPPSGAPLPSIEARQFPPCLPLGQTGCGGTSHLTDFPFPRSISHSLSHFPHPPPPPLDLQLFLQHLQHSLLDSQLPLAFLQFAPLPGEVFLSSH